MYLENSSALELRKVGNFVSESSFWKFYIWVWPSAAEGWNHLKVTSGVNFNLGWGLIQVGYICNDVTRSARAHGMCRGGGRVARWRRAWWGGGELDSGGSINHRSCWFVLTLQSHRAATVNVLAGILRGSMKERAWLNTHLLSWCVRTC